MSRIIRNATGVCVVLLVTSCSLFQLGKLPQDGPWDPASDRLTLDYSFGNGGVARRFVQTAPDFPLDEAGGDVVIDSTGALCIAGWVVDVGSNQPDMAFYRLTRFGLYAAIPVNGWIVDGGITGPAMSYGRDIAYRSDSRMFISGWSSDPDADGHVWVYDGAGFDFGFGPAPGGVFTIDGLGWIPGKNDWINDITTAPGNRVVVVGSTETEFQGNVGFIMRLEDNGSIDIAGFNPGDPTIGHIFVDWSTGSDRVDAVALNGGGDIVVAGSSNSGPNDSQNIFVEVFAENGSASFAQGSWDNTVIGDGDDRVSAMAIDEKNRIIVTGSTQNAEYLQRIMVLRFLPNGDPDPDFGTDGALIIETGHAGDDRAYDVAYSGGLIAVTGEATPDEPNGQTDMIVAVVGDDGMLFADFGVGGVLTAESSNAPPFDDFGGGVAFVPGESALIVSGASTVEGESKDLTVWKFLLP